MTKSQARLLVVDHIQTHREELSAMLSREGYAVVVAGSGQDALDRIEAEPVDLALLDLDMPGMSGLDVLTQVRQNHNPTHLPIIMFASAPENKDIVRALDLGANDYVTKPIDFRIVLNRVRTHLSLKHAEAARQESEERYALALKASSDGIWDWNLKSGEIVFSSRWKSALGYAEEEIGNEPHEWFDRIHPDDRARVEADLKAHIDGSASQFENEHRVLHCDGSYRWILSRGLAIRDHTGTAHRMAGSQTDITAGKVADALTGLPNRVLLMDRLNRLAERSRRNKDHLFAVLFLDLDQFKLINDSLGHLCGDRLLVAFTRRLQTELRSSDLVARLTGAHTVARLGGDEFTILLDDLKHPTDALRVAERLIEILKKPFSINGREIFATASIGVALSSTGYERPEDLLRDADTAMYRAKALRRNSVEIFDAEMRATAVARLQLETELRQGVERGEFVNSYQLIVNLMTGQIYGFEALVRWEHPTRGLILPDQFIQVAEETGAIIPIGCQVLKDACQQVRLWQEACPGTRLIVAVNLSSRQFLQPDLIDVVRDEILAAGIDADSLKLEITESMVMTNPVQAKAMIDEFKDIGVRIGMDDFGTGYSSLSYLHRFALDMLKIDRSFISGMEAAPHQLEIVKAIISLAQSLGLKVVAEGVENEYQMLLLREMGCEFGQGYLFSRPLDAAAATELLKSNPQWITSAARRRYPQNLTGKGTPVGIRH